MIDIVMLLNNKKSTLVFITVILVLFVAVMLLVRFCTDISSQPIWDEDYMYAENHVVQNIVDNNWSAKSMLDYEDTKGPVFFWIYAGWAELAGSDLDSLRLFSNILFILCAIPFVILARYAGLAGWRLLLAGIMFVLLPDLVVLSQLFMSEPLFIFGALWLLVIFICGSESARPVKYLIIYTILLSLMLHIRVHAVVYAGAIVLVASKRDGIIKSWSWWLATLIAGLSRVPLWLRWEGLVTPAFHDRYGLGFRLDSLTYLLIALLPVTTVMLAAFLSGKRDRRSKQSYLIIFAGAGCGLVLGILSCPDIAREAGADGSRFMGPVASALQPLLDKGMWLNVVIAVLSALGGAALFCTIMPLCNACRNSNRSLTVVQLCSIMVILGWLMYAFTAGDVFDRYMLISIILLPLVWVKRLPGWLVSIEFIGLLILLFLKIFTWLVPAVTQI